MRQRKSSFQDWLLKVEFKKIEVRDCSVADGVYAYCTSFWMASFGRALHVLSGSGADPVVSG